MMTRTDVHRPSSDDFDPEAYECHGVFDMDPEVPNPDETRYRIETIRALLGKGYRHGPGSSRKCGHCGAHIRYAALMVRNDVKEYIYVGEDCLEGRFEMTQAEFQTLRKNAALNRERVRKADKIATLVEEYPVLVWLTYVSNIDAPGRVYTWSEEEGVECYDYNRSTDVASRTKTGKQFSILDDLARKLNRYADLTANQAALADRLLTQISERWERYAERQRAAEALAATGVKVPSGRVVVEGEVVFTDYKESDDNYGRKVYSPKMIVKSDDGWKVWGTVPRSIEPDGLLEELKGKRVRFTAAVEAKASDPLFGFFKRPTKAEIVEA